METRAVWLPECQCLPFWLFGLFILGLIPPATDAFCGGRITVLDNGTNLEVSADCSVSSQVLIEWNSSPGLLDKMQIEYGCNMYNPDELQVAVPWSDVNLEDGNVTINLSISNNTQCVFRACYSVDENYGGVYEIAPVNCSIDIPSVFTSTTDVGSGITTPTVQPVPNTTQPGEMPPPTSVLEGVFTSPTDVGSGITTPTVQPVPNTTQPGEMPPPTSVLEARSTITSSVLHPLPTTTLPKETVVRERHTSALEGILNTVTFIVVPTSVFGAFTLFCVILFVIRRKKRRHKAWPLPVNMVVDPSIDIVSLERQRRFSNASAKTLYEFLERNDKCVPTPSDPQQQNHFEGETEGDMLSTESCSVTSETTPDSIMEVVTTKETQSITNTPDDASSRSYTAESVTHDIISQPERPHILYTDPQPVTTIPVIHSPGGCAVQLTNAGDGYCHVAINNTPNSSGNGGYQSMQELLNFYVSET